MTDFERLEAFGAAVLDAVDRWDDKDPECGTAGQVAAVVLASDALPVVAGYLWTVAAVRAFLEAGVEAGTLLQGEYVSVDGNGDAQTNEIPMWRLAQ